MLERCLKLETQLSDLPALKRQIQGYKKMKLDMDMANREQV